MTVDSEHDPLEALRDIVHEADVLEASGIYPPPSLENVLDHARRVVFYWR